MASDTPKYGGKPLYYGTSKKSPIYYGMSSAPYHYGSGGSYKSFDIVAPIIAKHIAGNIYFVIIDAT